MLIARCIRLSTLQTWVPLCQSVRTLRRIPTYGGILPADENDVLDPRLPAPRPFPIPDPPPQPSEFEYHSPRSEDPASYFFKSEVQQLLLQLTGVNYDKVFGVKKLGKPLAVPEYKFMTRATYERQLKHHSVKARERLQPPPYLKEREPIEEIISDDPELKGLLNQKLVFTDITPGVSNKDRIITVRQPDGKLRKATWEERGRMNNNYFPDDFRKHYVPHMFAGKYLQSLLDKREYTFILDRACRQFEPDQTEFISVSRKVYDVVDEKDDHFSLKNSRHFGSLMFHLCWVNRIENALVMFMRVGSVEDSVNLLKLYYLLQPFSSSVQPDTDPVGYVREFVEGNTTSKGELLKDVFRGFSRLDEKLNANS